MAIATLAIATVSLGGTISLCTLSKVALFFEKMHKVFKNKVQGCSAPLKGCFLAKIMFFSENFIVLFSMHDPSNER